MKISSVKHLHCFWFIAVLLKWFHSMIRTCFQDLNSAGRKKRSCQFTSGCKDLTRRSQAKRFILFDYFSKNCFQSSELWLTSWSAIQQKYILLLSLVMLPWRSDPATKNERQNWSLYLAVVWFPPCRLRVFLHDVQHRVMKSQEEDGRLNLVIEEAAVVQFLQDVGCGSTQVNTRRGTSCFLRWIDLFSVISIKTWEPPDYSCSCSNANKCCSIAAMFLSNCN